MSCVLCVFCVALGEVGDDDVCDVGKAGVEDNAVGLACVPALGAFASFSSPVRGNIGGGDGVSPPPPAMETRAERKGSMMSRRRWAISAILNRVFYIFFEIQFFVAASADTVNKTRNDAAERRQPRPSPRRHTGKA